MNAFLFNILIVLISSVSITQFCTAAFVDYTAFSDISIIFNVQIRYLVFFVYFYKYNIFPYILVVIFFISLIYLLCRPNDMNSLERMVNFI
jgi:LMBR1 domain-containing protein 1